MSKPYGIQVWRRCNNCGRTWLGSKSTKSCTDIIDGVRIHCGSGRLIRYPDQDAECQRILQAVV